MKPNNKVEMKFSRHDDIFVVNYDELLNAFELFTKKVKRFFSKHVPPLDRTDWGRWVKGEAEWDDVTFELVPVKSKKLPWIKFMGQKILNIFKDGNEIPRNTHTR
ncbi:MAG: hypothetical protein HZB76_03980 [Chlamydiae bacterium]|nr:hypothetical protein [Chlamydiota bacterium]